MAILSRFGRSASRRWACPALLVLALLGGISAVRAQAPSFNLAVSTGTMSTPGKSYGASVAYDAQGNMYVTGNFAGTAVFGSTTLTSNNPNTGIADMFVAKLSPTGSWLWARRAGGTNGGTAESLAVDGSGNVYLTGNFSGATADFGPTTLSGGGNQDLFAAKLDASGTWLWARRAGGTEDDRSYTLALDAGGNAYVAGYFESPSAAFGSTALTTLTTSTRTSTAAFVAKLDAAGNWLWARSVGGTATADAFGAGVAVDGSGATYLTGAFYGTQISFGSTTFGSSASGNNDDLFVAKLDAAGNWLWAKRAGSSGSNDFAEGNTVAVDAGGSVYVAGEFDGAAASFGSTSLASSGDEDMFVAKLDAAGNWLWARRAGGTGYDYATSMVLGAGGAVVAGFYGDAAASFGSTTLTNAGREDAFVAQLDASGNWLWAKRAGGPNDERCNALALSTTGAACVVGTYDSNSVAFDGTTLTKPAAVTELGFVARLTSLATATAPTLPTEVLQLYPNPATGPDVRLSAQGLAGSTAEVSIRNALGQQVSQQRLPLRQGQVDQRLGLPPLPAGIYTVQLRTVAGVALRRLVLH